MYRIILFILIVFIQVSHARAQAVHYFSCVEVLDNGDVMLRWSKPVGAGSFVAYNIYRTTLANPDDFQLVGQHTVYGDTSFVHSTATANQEQNIYYILTEQNGVLPDIISDTLNTIHLTVDNADPYLAVLDWNPMHDPLLAASNTDYEILSHNPSTGFSPVGSTPAVHFEMPLAVCWDTLYFKVVIGDVNGCNSSSNVFSAVFRDDSPPPIPYLDSVSIDPYSGEVILGWPESPAGDAGGYVIYHVMSSINDTLDFVMGKENTNYLDLSFDPCVEHRSYALSSFDTCINISPGSYGVSQRTILFNEVVFDPCAMTNHLSWTSYINMNPVLEGYRVYLSTEGAAFELLTSLQAGTTSYAHTGLEADRTYKYFIRAFSSGDIVTSTSCFRELSTWQYKQPLENAFANASVINGEVALTMRPDTYAHVPGLNLYRSLTSAGPFEYLAQISLSGEDEVYYDDLTAAVKEQSYYYQSSLVDSCGNEVLFTNPVRTILLQGEKSGNQMNSLSWNAFEGWPSGIAGYEIYRSIDENGSFDYIGSSSPSALAYEDDISSLSGEFSHLHYIVGAIQSGDPDRKSWSNDLVFEYTPRIHLPNAFTPGGHNPVFQPVGLFTDFSEYRFDIYNRWGDLIFTSRDFDTGWDGTYNGSDAPTAVYVCIITYRSGTGDSNTIKSTFVLIR
ncbi:MAG: gliding motility-associated C-terminal domain-containing protein [Bacteroidota bacterium]